MKKKIYRLFLIITGLLVLTPLALMAQDITIDFSMPGKAVAGEKIPVKVVIHKGAHTDFARFKQKIPPGFEVKPVQSANSDFTFKNGEINFIWLKLPTQKDITIDYLMIPNIRLQGVFHFTGLFSYINEGEREEIAVPEKTLTILPSPLARKKDTVSQTSAASKKVTGKPSSSSLIIYREVPEKTRDGKSWIVRILIQRGFVDKLARVEENIPEGYIAENIEGKGSIFSYRSGNLKYIWMNMPSDSLFVISYKLVPVDKRAKEPPSVTGTFSYMLNNQPAIKKIKSVKIPIPLHASEKDYSMLITELNKTSGAQMMAEKPAENSASVPAVGTAVPAKTVAVSENKPGLPTEIVRHPAAKARGIYFRVQILATRHPVEIERYMKEHHIPGKIYRETDNGLYKYATGSFTLYRDARAFVEHLMETSDIDGAFVTAYDNGKRITVREALDRTGQKWFK